MLSATSSGCPRLYCNNFSSGFKTTPASSHCKRTFWVGYETAHTERETMRQRQPVDPQNGTKKDIKFENYIQNHCISSDLDFFLFTYSFRCKLDRSEEKKSEEK